jgi:hypothetical protein
MKGIYITEEGKKDIKDRIAELEEENKFPVDKWEEEKNQGKIYILEEILSSATILPVEESYNNIQHFETSEHGTVIRKHFLMANYSKGVIIQPKQ